jgi:hypothetical protein
MDKKEKRVIRQAQEATPSGKHHGQHGTTKQVEQKHQVTKEQEERLAWAKEKKKAKKVRHFDRRKEWNTRQNPEKKKVKESMGSDKERESALAKKKMQNRAADPAVESRNTVKPKEDIGSDKEKNTASTKKKMQSKEADPAGKPQKTVKPKEATSAGKERTTRGKHCNFFLQIIKVPSKAQLKSNIKYLARLESNRHAPKATKSTEKSASTTYQMLYTQGALDTNQVYNKFSRSRRMSTARGMLAHTLRGGPSISATTIAS